jgi:hypothetical protein
VWQVDVRCGESGGEGQGAAVITICEDEDLLSVREGYCCCYGHGITFSAGIGKADEFNAGW